MGRGRYKFFEPDVITEWYTPPAAPINPELFDRDLYKNIYSFDVPQPITEAAEVAAAAAASSADVDQAKNLVKSDANTTAETGYHFIGVDTANQPITITLPSNLNIATGKILLIKDEGGNASTNSISVNTSDGSKIDGQDSIVLKTDYAAIQVYYNGTEWSIY